MSPPDAQNSNFGRLVACSPKGEGSTTSPVEYHSPWDWAKPSPFRCPRCGTITLTREGGAPVPALRIPGGDVSRPLRARRPGLRNLPTSCLVCGKRLAWPALYFCGPSCSDVWIDSWAERRRKARRSFLSKPSFVTDAFPQRDYTPTGWIQRAAEREATLAGQVEKKRG